MKQAEKLAKAAYEAVSAGKWADVSPEYKEKAIAAVQNALDDDVPGEDEKGEPGEGDGGTDIVGPRPGDR